MERIAALVAGPWAAAGAATRASADRKNKPFFAPGAHANRHHTEPAINKLRQFGRIAARYDKWDRSYESFVCPRLITLCLN